MPESREEIEAQLEPQAEAALKAWLAVALADVVGSTVNPTVVLQHAADWVEQVGDRLAPIIRAAFVDRFTAIADRPPSRNLIAAYMDAATNRMVRVPDEVAARIHRIVARNIGTSIPDMATLIDAELSFSGTANWPNRATVIARTESGGAWNGATIGGYRADAQRYGLDLQKKWLATDDERTRLTHVAADGQTVPLDASYTVGGFPMDFPSDPRGPAHEVINCRCAMRIGTLSELFGARTVIAAPTRTLRFADGVAEDTVCIMALPAADDPVHEIGPEEKHATLLYFGRVSEHHDSARMAASRGLLAEVLRVAAGERQPFDAAVSSIGELGDEGARVWHLESPELRVLFRDIPDIDSEVQSLYDDAEATRYPTYQPHVTIGYVPPGDDLPGTDEAREDGTLSDDQLDEAHRVESIRFDRLALWWGDERYEFPLGEGRQAASMLEWLRAVRDQDGAWNWVDDCGGLPSLIRRIADHVIADGNTESRAIATAVNAVKKTCATGDVNWPGIQQVNPGYRAEACAAVGEWEALKACAAARD